jgi:hypothetical protein
MPLASRCQRRAAACVPTLASNPLHPISLGFRACASERRVLHACTLGVGQAEGRAPGNVAPRYAPTACLGWSGICSTGGSRSGTQAPVESCRTTARQFEVRRATLRRDAARQWTREPCASPLRRCERLRSRRPCSVTWSACSGACSAACRPRYGRISAPIRRRSNATTVTTCATCAASTASRRMAPCTSRCSDPTSS